MLKRTILLLSAVMLLGTVEAQVRIAPIMGFNFNRQVQTSNNNRFQGVFNTKLHFSLGAMADILLTDYLSVQPELLYTFKGGSYDLEPSSVSESFSTNLGYIQMPVCITGKIDVKRGFLFAGVGPYVSRLTYSNYTLEQNYKNVDAGQLRMGKDYLRDQVTPWDYGVKFKAGLELNRGFYMGAFYDYGTKDVNPQFAATRNRTVGVQFGWSISLTEEDRYERFENFYEF
jgi:hypothetical protein